MSSSSTPALAVVPLTLRHLKNQGMPLNGHPRSPAIASSGLFNLIASSMLSDRVAMNNNALGPTTATAAKGQWPQVKTGAASSSGQSSLLSTGCRIFIQPDCPRYSWTTEGPHSYRNDPKLDIKTHPREFLFHFKKHAQKALGDLFPSEAYRLLILAILDVNVQLVVQERLQKEPGATWERIEEIFVSNTMTAADHYKDFQDLLQCARLDKEARETYRQFVERYREKLQILGIRDENFFVLAHLNYAFEDQVIHLSLTAVLRGYEIVKPGFTSISQLLFYLERLPGPSYRKRASRYNNSSADKNDGMTSFTKKSSSQTSTTSSP